MNRVVWKLFLNFEKEEQWINEMAARGLNFTGYTFGRYTLEEGVPGEYIYRIELLNQLPTHPESKAYIEFMDETGVECVSTYLRWVYFRKKADEGAFDLYSDYDSRIKHYKRVAALVGTLGGANLSIAISNFTVGLTGRTEHGLGYTSVYISMANFALVILLLPMFISFIRKINRMKKEKQLYQ